MVKYQRKFKESPFITTVGDSTKHIIQQFEDELKSLDGRIKYCKEALSQSDIEPWETKEYKAVLQGNLKRKKEIENHLKNLKSNK